MDDDLRAANNTVQRLRAELHRDSPGAVDPAQQIADALRAEGRPESRTLASIVDVLRRQNDELRELARRVAQVEDVLTAIMRQQGTE